MSTVDTQYVLLTFLNTWITSLLIHLVFQNTLSGQALKVLEIERVTKETKGSCDACVSTGE